MTPVLTPLAPLLRPGSLFVGRFLIDQQIGHGGMGSIYRAVDQETGSTVAIKVLRSGGEDPMAVDRFLREARLLERLSHDSIVRHISHGSISAGIPYLAMEWVDGEDLSHRLSHRGLNDSETLQVLRCATGALAAVHREGIVHRDVKPSNLLLRNSEPSQTVLLDFGIARNDRATMALTQTGAILGTPEYMSPEQARGDEGLRPSADIFSLGCVLYECLTGKTPFRGDHLIAILTKILFEDPIPLDVLRPDLPEELVALITSMLAKDPAARPADGKVMLNFLDALPPLRTGDATVRTSVEARPALTEREQQYICVVLARSLTKGHLFVEDYASLIRHGVFTPTENSALDQTVQEQADATVQTSPTALRAGVRIETLLDGSLVAVVAEMGSPKEQAVHAARLALKMREQLKDAAIIVATGRGVLSDRLPIGDAIERAVKLYQPASAPAEAGAEPVQPQVVLDETTARFLDGSFFIERSTSAPPRLIQELQGESGSRPVLGKSTPCIGRDPELGMLEGVYQGCIDEQQPSAVILVGPPGMGKSRLRHEFIRRIRARADKPLLLFGRGDVMAAGSLYGLLRQACRGMLSTQDSDSLAAQQEKLRQRVAEVVPVAAQERVTVFLGELCGVPFSNEASVALRGARQDPRAMSEQVSRAFNDFMRAECARQPVILILEDLHWGDALTVRLLQEALRVLHDSPLMILATARPEIHVLFPNLWAGRSQTITLNGLGKRACEQLIKRVLGAGVDPEVINRIVSRASGNALYLEELMRAASEDGGEELPETVLAMVQARLLKIPPDARRILRAASVFGETFTRGGVIALSGGERQTQRVDALLSALITSETITARTSSRLPDDREYGFHHALIRDAAYGMIPAEELLIVHQRAAEYLEACGEDDPMVLAEHYRRSAARDQAAKYYVLAAEQAYFNNDTDAMLLRAQRGIESGATGEQLGLLKTFQGRAHGWREDWAKAYPAGSEALDLLPAGHLWWYRGLTSMFVITSMAGMQKEFGALVARFAQSRPLPDARGAYVEAGSGLVVVLSLLGMRGQVRQLLGGMAAIGGELITTDLTTRGWMRYAQSTACRFLDANPWQMLQVAQEGCAAFESAASLHSLALVRGMHSAALLELGDFDAAESVARDNLALTRRLGDQFLISNALVLLAQVAAVRGEAGLAEAQKLCEEVISASDKAIFVGRALTTLTQVQLMRGEFAQALETAQKGAARLMPIASEHYRTMTNLANALRLLGKPEEAVAACEQTLKRLETLQNTGFSEVGLHLATALAKKALGPEHEEGARAAVRAGLTAIKLRADNISDEAARKRYLENPIDIAPLRGLADAMAVAI